MGIAVCGSGLGTLVFPAIMPYIIDEPLSFKYNGALLLEAGIIFICVVFGILMVIVQKMNIKDEIRLLNRFHYLKNLVKSNEWNENHVLQRNKHVKPEQ